MVAVRREQDHYAVLELTPAASAAEIKRRYRILMREVHPDANAGDPQATRKAARINLAFETLGNAERRRAYDATLPAANGRRAPARTRRSDKIYAHWAEQENWEDLVAASVPPRRAPHRHAQTPAIEPAEVEVDLAELRLNPRVRRRIRVSNPCDCTLRGDVSTSEPWVWGPIGTFELPPGGSVEFDIEVIGRKVRFPGLSRVQFIASSWTGSVPVKITGFEAKRTRHIPATGSRYAPGTSRRRWSR